MEQKLKLPSIDLHSNDEKFHQLQSTIIVEVIQFHT